MRECIGGLLVAAPFVVLISVMLLTIGWQGTLFVLSFTGVVCGSIGLGCYLLSEESV